MNKHISFLKGINKTDKEMTEFYTKMSETNFVASIFFEKISDWHELEDSSLKFLVDFYSSQAADENIENESFDYFLKQFDNKVEMSQKLLKHFVVRYGEQRKFADKDKTELLAVVKIKERIFLFTWVNFLQVVIPSRIKSVVELDSIDENFSKSAYKIRKK